MPNRVKVPKNALAPLDRVGANGTVCALSVPWLKAVSQFDRSIPATIAGGRFRPLKANRPAKPAFRPAALSVLLITAVLPAMLLADSTDTYIDGRSRFAEISSPQEQAEAWAVCAAAYDVMSTIMQVSAPERARQLHHLANGAQVSIGMALVAAQLEIDTDTTGFVDLWAAHEAAMVDLPQQKLADILEDGEAMGDERAAEFGNKINATVFTCIENLDTQRDYVESWRELAEKGLVKPPED